MAGLQVRSLTKKSLNLGGIPAALWPWSGFPPGLLDSFYTHLQRASPGRPEASFWGQP